MHGLIYEEDGLGAKPTLKDLALDIYSRMSSGKIVVVAEKPHALLGPLRKQWLKLIRSAETERAKTLNAAKIEELTGRIAHMREMRFAATWYNGDADFDYPYDVCIATSDHLMHWPPEYKTMYVTCKLDRERLFMITTWMRPGSLVVVCELGRS